MCGCLAHEEDGPYLTLLLYVLRVPTWLCVIVMLRCYLCTLCTYLTNMLWLCYVLPIYFVNLIKCLANVTGTYYMMYTASWQRNLSGSKIIMCTFLSFILLSNCYPFSTFLYLYEKRDVENVVYVMSICNYYGCSCGDFPLHGFICSV